MIKTGDSATGAKGDLEWKCSRRLINQLCAPATRSRQSPHSARSKGRVDRHQLHLVFKQQLLILKTKMLQLAQQQSCFVGKLHTSMISFYARKDLIDLSLSHTLHAHRQYFAILLLTLCTFFPFEIKS